MEVNPAPPRQHCPSSSRAGWLCGGRSPVRFHEMSPSGNDNFENDVREGTNFSSTVEERPFRARVSGMNDRGFSPGCFWVAQRFSAAISL